MVRYEGCQHKWFEWTRSNGLREAHFLRDYINEADVIFIEDCTDTPGIHWVSQYGDRFMPHFLSPRQFCRMKKHLQICEGFSFKRNQKIALKPAK